MATGMPVQVCVCKTIEIIHAGMRGYRHIGFVGIVT